VRNIASNEHRLGTEHPNLVGPLDNLGIVLRKQGRHVEAEALHRRALAIAVRGFGEDSTPAASARLGLGATLLRLERAEEAVPELERAESVLCGSSKSPSRCGEVRFALARARFVLDRDPAEAVSLARAALADFERAGASADEGRREAQAWLASRERPGHARSSGRGP
jgi:hypothetical protein